MKRVKTKGIAWRRRKEARVLAVGLKPIQLMIETAIARETQVSRLMARLFAKKLKAQGMLDIENRLDELQTEIEKQLLSGNASDSFVFDDGFPGQRDGLTLQFSEAELEEFSDSVTSAAEIFTEETIDAIFVETLDSVREQSEEALGRRAEELRSFQQRLLIRWKKPLQLLSVQIGLSVQFGEQMNGWLRGKADKDNSSMVDVLTRLHARATQVAGEIEVLLKEGFADGAMSRWRTLHELTIVAFFINKYGNEAAERYRHHLRIDSLRMARRLNDAASKLGCSPISDQEFLEIQEDVAALKLKFGEAFCTEYGWAADALHKQKPTFADIESAVQLEQYRPYFKLASDSVHAGPKGTFHRLGLALDRVDTLLAGPSNAGLEEAGRLTALSLGQIASSLITLHPLADGVVWAKVIGKLGIEVEEEFIKVSKKLERDEFGPRKPSRVQRNG